jgi:hypothetical protein
MTQIKCYCGHTTYCDCGPLDEPVIENQRTNRERFLELVSNEETNTIERAKKRIAERQEPGIIKQLVEEMKNDPWHVKLRRWFRLQRWVWMCRTRWIWDLDYEHNIFRKRR